MAAERTPSPPPSPPVDPEALGRATALGLLAVMEAIGEAAPDLAQSLAVALERRVVGAQADSEAEATQQYLRRFRDALYATDPASQALEAALIRAADQAPDLDDVD